MLTDRLQAKLKIHASLPSPAQRRAIRSRLGLTQADLAEALATTPQSIGRWERGERLPRGPQLSRYLELLSDLAER